MEDKKHYCQLNVKSFVFTGAILWGLYLFILALFTGFGIKFIWINKELVEILASAYPGYKVGFNGALIGLVYGLIDGGICAGLFAWLYNKLCR